MKCVLRSRKTKGKTEEERELRETKTLFVNQVAYFAVERLRQRALMKARILLAWSSFLGFAAQRPQSLSLGLSEVASIGFLHLLAGTNKKILNKTMNRRYALRNV